MGSQRRQSGPGVAGAGRPLGQPHPLSASAPLEAPCSASGKVSHDSQAHTGPLGQPDPQPPRPPFKTPDSLFSCYSKCEGTGLGGTDGEGPWTSSRGWCHAPLPEKSAPPTYTPLSQTEPHSRRPVQPPRTPAPRAERRGCLLLQLPEVEPGNLLLVCPSLPVHWAGGTSTPEQLPRAQRGLEGKDMEEGRGAEGT